MWPVLEEVSKSSQRAAMEKSAAPASALGLQLHHIEVRSADDFERASRSSAKSVRTSALSCSRRRDYHRNRKRIADLATKHRLPAIYQAREFVDGRWS
mgnify:CR=1 FL=1